MGRPVSVLPVAVLAIAIAGLTPVGAQDAALGGSSQVEPVVVPTERQDTSAPLRRLAAAAGDEEAKGRAHPTLRRDRPTGAAGTGSAGDPVVDRVRPTAAVPIEENFEGTSNLDNWDQIGALPVPPDTVGDVGPNHYVQMTNVVTTIFDKSGTTLQGPFPNNMFWQGLGGACQTTNDGDPIVLHDQLADRWLVSQFALPNFPNGPFFVCVAISQTADPTGSYHRYSFPFQHMPDYPKFGVWPNGYFMSANMFQAGSLNYLRPQLLALDRLSMLSGGPANAHGFLLTGNSFTVLPSDLDGTTLPPAGAPNHFIELREPPFFPQPKGLHVWDFKPNYGSPANATLSGPKPVGTSNYDSNLCNFNPNCIPQPNTSQKVDALSGRLMHRAAYRNFGAHESLVVAHTVDVGVNQAGVRWHEVRRLSASPSLYQEGTISGGPHRWMPSISMDRQGNIAVGYSVSGNNVFPSIRFSARRANQRLGAMGLGETTVRAGSGSQTGANRWGDYAAMTPDPSDDTVLWFTHEYYQTTDTSPGTFPLGRNWQTRIASILMPQLRCMGRPVTWAGTRGADTFVGTGAADVVLALGGADSIDTRGGPDRVCAGGGKDTVRLRAGHDRVRGQGGADLVVGGPGNDILNGNPGDDTLRGAGGNDTLRGHAGNDVLNGGPGFDTCRGGPGRDRLRNCEN